MVESLKAGQSRLSQGAEQKKDVRKVKSAGKQVTLAPTPRSVDLVRRRPDGVLRFSPKAWAKFNWFRDRGETEIAGFGLSRLDDPLYVVEFATVRQEAGAATFKFDDDALNNYLMDMVERGWQPAECMRIWLHSHPKGWGGKPAPSGHDNEVFSRCFGKCDWSVMCILGDNGAAYARLYLSAASGRLAMSCELRSEVDHTGAFEGVTGADVEVWEKEYLKNVGILDWVCDIDPRSSAYDWHNLCQRGWDLNDGDRRVDEHFDDDELSVLLGDEEIVTIADDESGTNVYASDYWFAYPHGTRLLKKEGDFFYKISELSTEKPLAWGELSWGGAEGATPLVTSFYHDGHFVQTNDATLADDDDGGLMDFERQMLAAGLEKDD